MQTFTTLCLNEVDGDYQVLCEEIARSLDPKRLGKQRVEAKQILQGSFPHHPATKMWAGHHPALAAYGWAMCSEWIANGWKDSLQGWFRDQFGPGFKSVTWPWWFGHDAMVATHRSKLIRKLPQFYENHMANGPYAVEFRYYQYAQDYRLPYIWPSMDGSQEFYLSKAELKREDEWEIPRNWGVDARTGLVMLP